MFRLKNYKFSYFIFFITFIIAGLILTSLSVYYANKNIKSKIHFIQKSGPIQLNSKINLMQNRLSIIKNYSETISSVIKEFDIYDEHKISKLLKSHFLKELGIFQLRLLNHKGIESIRYDLTKQNEIVKSKYLQDKSDRYYFLEAKNISQNDIYFSKFDLNVENKKIEIPYKDTTRVIKKINIGDETYYIVINYDLTSIFKNSLNSTLYDIFLIDKDEQINMHLNNKHSFSKQKNKNLYLKDLINYEHQFITQKKLENFPYKVVICIKEARLVFMQKERNNSIVNFILISIIISAILSLVILYFLTNNLKRFTKTASQIMENTKYSIKDEFVEFKVILHDLEIQHSTIQESLTKIDKQKNYINSILDSQSNFTVITNGKNLIDTNMTMLSFFGYEDLESFHKEHDCICDFFIPDPGYLAKEMDRKSWLDIILIDKNKNYNVKIKDLNDNIHIYQLTANELEIEKHSYVITFTDISEILILKNSLQEKVTEQIDQLRIKDKKLFEQSKMAAMGDMIGNIAHQWRQPLSFISTASTAMILEKELGILSDKQIKTTCKAINSNAQYLSKTINAFRDFIRGDSEKTIFKLEDEIDSFLQLIDGTIKSSNITIVKNSDNNIEVNSYKNELMECLINIFNNASDILNEKDIREKYIFISTSTNDQKVTIKIKDNAGGIPDEVLPKIFEPYFTTKHKSQGTGLGLHMTYNLIVDGMEGSIEAVNKSYEYNNTQFNGAEFTITLPLLV